MDSTMTQKDNVIHQNVGHMTHDPSENSCEMNSDTSDCDSTLEHISSYTTPRGSYNVPMQRISHQQHLCGGKYL